VPRNAVVSVGYLWGRTRDAYLRDFCGAGQRVSGGPPARSRSSAAPAVISSSVAAPHVASRWAMLASRAPSSPSESGPGRERVT
jgi:hypothetical protein